LNIFASDLVRVAISSAPSNLVPFYSTDSNSQNINRLTHISLIDFDANMEYQCIACKSYSEVFQGEKHSIRFKLREDLMFSDGTPVTVKDVENAIIYFSKNDKINSTFKSSFDHLIKVNIKNQNEIELIYDEYSAENLGNLSLIKILKIKPTADLEHLRLEDLIGAGKYQIYKVEPLEIELHSRENNRPNYVFKVVKDETTLALKIINNEIDLSVASISPRKLNWLKENSKQIKTVEKPSGNYLFLAMNQETNFLKNVEIRKAISLLIPREDLLKYKLKNTAVLSNGMFSPAFKSMYSSRKIDEYDPQKAEEIFKLNGYKKNKNGYYTLNNKEINLDWKVSNNKSSIEMVEVLKDIFKKAGIKVTISIQEWGTFMSSFKAGKFDLIMSQWVGFSGPDMLRFVFHSENTPPKGGNRIRYKNLDFDKQIDMAVKERDHVKALEYFRAADNIINQNYPYVHLWHPNVIWVANKCLNNINLESTGSFYALLSLENNCHVRK
jgi:peptide/nickel transport system substrate-binding protein